MRDDMRGKVGMRMKTGSKWLTGAPLAASHDRGLGWGGHTPTVCCPGGDRGQWPTEGPRLSSASSLACLWLSPAESSLWHVRLL